MNMEKDLFLWFCPETLQRQLAETFPRNGAHPSPEHIRFMEEWGRLYFLNNRQALAAHGIYAHHLARPPLDRPDHVPVPQEELLHRADLPPGPQLVAQPMDRQDHVPVPDQQRQNQRFQNNFSISRLLAESVDRKDQHPKQAQVQAPIKPPSFMQRMLPQAPPVPLQTSPMTPQMPVLSPQMPVQIPPIRPQMPLNITPMAPQMPQMPPERGRETARRGARGGVLGRPRKETSSSQIPPFQQMSDEERKSYWGGIRKQLEKQNMETQLSGYQQMPAQMLPKQRRGRPRKDPSRDQIQATPNYHHQIEPLAHNQVPPGLSQQAQGSLLMQLQQLKRQKGNPSPDTRVPRKHVMDVMLQQGIPHQSVLQYCRQKLHPLENFHPSPSGVMHLQSQPPIGQLPNPPPMLGQFQSSFPGVQGTQQLPPDLQHCQSPPPRPPTPFQPTVFIAGPVGMEDEPNNNTGFGGLEPITEQEETTLPDRVEQPAKLYHEIIRQLTALSSSQLESVKLLIVAGNSGSAQSTVLETTDLRSGDQTPQSASIPMKIHQENLEDIGEAMDYGADDNHLTTPGGETGSSASLTFYSGVGPFLIPDMDMTGSRKPYPDVGSGSGNEISEPTAMEVDSSIVEALDPALRSIQADHQEALEVVPVVDQAHSRTKRLGAPMEEQPVKRLKITEGESMPEQSYNIQQERLADALNDASQASDRNEVVAEGLGQNEDILGGENPTADGQDRQQSTHGLSANNFNERLRMLQATMENSSEEYRRECQTVLMTAVSRFSGPNPPESASEFLDEMIRRLQNNSINNS